MEIPALSAAWMIMEPLGAVSSLPSISMLTRLSFLCSGCALMGGLLSERGMGNGEWGIGKVASYELSIPYSRLPIPDSRSCTPHSCRNLLTRINHGMPVLDVVLEFVPVIGQERLHRPRRGFAEGADGVAFDLAGDGLEAVQVVLLSLPGDDALEHAVHPAGALAARRALAAGLGIVELRDALASLDHASGLVHDDDRARAQARTGLLQAVVVHGAFEH